MTPPIGNSININNLTPEQKKVYQLGKEAVAGFKQASESEGEGSSSTSFANREFDVSNPSDLKEYKKLVQVYAHGMWAQTDINNGGDGTVTIKEVSKSDNPIVAKAKSSLFSDCDLNSNKKVDVKDLMALVIYADQMDGKFDGKSPDNALSSLGKSSISPFTDLGSKFESSAKKLKLNQPLMSFNDLADTYAFAKE